jgi:cGMP-dependent protein kinase
MHTELSSKFPSFFKDRTSKKFIEQLLSKQPEARIGASYASLKAHPWFDDFDWDRLFNKELQPPVPIFLLSQYVPPTNSLISNKEFEYMYQQGKPVVSEIKTE